jgi:catechol 2,3-dioxygenase-like lactoylglutathione lyase family enzyme
MRRVTGLGGVFFEAANPERLYAWYENHLGLKRGNGGVDFHCPGANGESNAKTVWALFEKGSGYLKPSAATFMLNYRVENLDALLEQLRIEGVWIDPKREDHDYGRFAWIMDPEGNRIELWEPSKVK